MQEIDGRAATIHPENTAKNNRTTQRIALSTAIFSSFLPPFMISSLDIALPAIGEGFSLSAASLGWVATSYLLAAAVVLMPVGKAADIVGRRKLYAIGLALYSGSSLLCFGGVFASMVRGKLHST